MRIKWQPKWVLPVVFLFIAVGWVFLMQENRNGVTIADNRGQLIRLHIIANSDRNEDQKVKLQVRDAIVNYLTPRLKNVTDIATARRIVLENKAAILAAADEVLQRDGRPYQAKMQIGLFDFPIKSYGNLVLPAGRYEAVRVLLGDGGGKNWWCVLFPPLCFIDTANATAIPVVADKKKHFAVNSDQPEKLEFKWKILELWNK
ncbi:stage ii sporulation protein r (spore ii r) [Lucifera butyrica]|uniref:Stage ii sporulation protein r (Spore ii r) n=1 Tax=Lucifera butyrica TaxID=1351585 RepID=A0A498RAR6_9FIRM|nr:stage II sporulation protein R [Lucifera butyrica]VBB06208.1 stage ii sporulation protein r (spore ii r) [Lucifera butyrica]